MTEVTDRRQQSGNEPEREPDGKHQRHRPWWLDPAFVVGVALFLFGGPLNYFSRNPKILYLGAFGASILIFYGVHRYISSIEAAQTPPKPPQPNPAAMAGKLKAEPTLLFSSKASFGTQLEIGDSGTVFLHTGKPGSPLMRLGDDAIIVERLADGEVAITTTIRDPSGKIVAEIVRNEWRLRPSLLWDRNFNASAVEVRAENGDVVLQVQALRDRIRLQGMWYTTAGKFIEFLKSPDPKHPGGLIVMGVKHKLPIQPMFQYPSDAHLGELLPN
jgi:hypothetical protein